ncbi:MAG: hypothetical protein SPI30_07385 [Prevotella sp.]|nr:hypothetical protein [Prevotella sp.]
MKEMIMKKMTLLILLLSALCNLHAQVSVEQKLDSMEMFIGEQVHLTLSVTAAKGQRISFPLYKPGTYLIHGIEVLEHTDADTIYTGDNTMRLERRYTLTSFVDTLYYIPPIPVEVNGRKYQGNPLALKVMTVDVDTLHPEQFFPPKSVQDNPFRWSEWQEVFLLSILTLILAVFAGWLYLRLRDNKPVLIKMRIVKRIPPHQKAMDEIERIKAERLNASENPKEYYTRLTDTIRTYLHERFGINAMEMTSAEIIERLQQEDDKEKLSELKELFETADLVKFAKYATLINENDRNLTNAVAFINSTKSEETITEEKIAPPLTEPEKRGRRSRIILKTAIGLIVSATLALCGYIVWQLTMLLD